MNIFIDIETRSPLGLVSTYKYAKHPMTEIICMAYKIDDQPTDIVYPILGHPINIFKRGSVFIAHNAEFERAFLDDEVELDWQCTCAMACAMGLPPFLEKLCHALGVAKTKDMQGNMLMKKMCHPQKDGTYIQDAESLRRLGEYCKADVEATAACYNKMNLMSQKEKEVYELTLDINRRGMRVDIPLAKQAVKLDEESKKALLSEFQVLTGIDSPGCLDKVKAFLLTYGVNLPDLSAAVVAEALERDMHQEARRVLEIRQLWSKTSVAKFEALLERVEPDERVRGLFMYHAATTGRWSGKGLQPHNLPSRNLIKNVELAVEAVKAGMPAETLECLWGESVPKILSSIIRPTIIASPGKKLICADFASIEARVLAWLAGEEWVLEAYRKDVDLYVRAAAKIYHIHEKQVSPAQRQIGKVSILACGYQGGKNAFQKMAANYGITIPEEEAQEIVTAWREANPMIVKYWGDLQSAALTAMREGVCPPFAKMGDHLYCKLPSGRVLCYPFAYIKAKETPWGQMLPTIHFKTMTQGQWVTSDTYGGKLCENITQGVARDLLAEAMLRTPKKYEIILHVHDEILAECEHPDLEEFESVMRVVPEWATGLPLGASGWIGERYRK